MSHDVIHLWKHRRFASNPVTSHLSSLYGGGMTDQPPVPTRARITRSGDVAVRKYQVFSIRTGEICVWKTARITRLVILFREAGILLIHLEFEAELLRNTKSGKVAQTERRTWQEAASSPIHVRLKAQLSFRPSKPSVWRICLTVISFPSDLYTWSDSDSCVIFLRYQDRQHTADETEGPTRQLCTKSLTDIPEAIVALRMVK